MEMLANFLHNSFEKPPESYKMVANRKGREGVVRGICVLYTFADDDPAENILDMRVLPAKFEGGHFGHLGEYLNLDRRVGLWRRNLLTGTTLHF